MLRGGLPAVFVHLAGVAPVDVEPIAEHGATEAIDRLGNGGEGGGCRGRLASPGVATVAAGATVKVA